MTNSTPPASGPGLKITVDDIVQAYATAKAKPRRYAFLRDHPEGRECCAVGALVLAKHPEFYPSYRGDTYVGFSTQMQEDYGLTDDETQQLANGFDDASPTLPEFPVSPYSPYYLLGRAAAKAVGL